MRRGYGERQVAAVSQDREAALARTMATQEWTTSGAGQSSEQVAYQRWRTHHTVAAEARARMLGCVMTVALSSLGTGRALPREWRHWKTVGIERCSPAAKGAHAELTRFSARAAQMGCGTPRGDGSCDGGSGRLQRKCAEIAAMLQRWMS